MTIRFAVAALVSLAGATSVMAQAATTPEQCLKSSFELAKAADAKKLPDAQLDKIEDMLTRMEKHCDQKQFAEAAKVGTEIKTAIGIK